MSNLNLYTSTLIGSRYRTPSIKSAREARELHSVNKIKGYSFLEELRVKFIKEDGIMLGHEVSVTKIHPMTIPLTIENGDRWDNTVVLDMRDYIIAENRIDEDSGIYGIKTSKFNLTYVQLLLGIGLLNAVKGGDVTSAINHLPMRAYTHWLSEAITKGKQVQNVYQVVLEIRVLTALYFLMRLNGIVKLEAEDKLFMTRTIQKHLRLTEEMVADIIERVVKDEDRKVTTLGNLLSNYVEHPSFKDFGDTALITLIGRHVNIDGNSELGALAVDSPIVFATILHHAFTRDFNVRSNFKTILENGVIDVREIQEWAKGYVALLTR